MNNLERAKIFAPFNPLSGFSQALREKEKITIPKAELTEERVDELAWRLKTLVPGNIVSAVYYIGGEYCKICGCVAEISFDRQIIRIVDTEIPFVDLYELEE